MSNPVLLCFDGSDVAAAAIAHAGAILGSREAVVLTIRESGETWDPYDPATVVDAGIAKVTPVASELDEIAQEIAQKTVDRGVEVAREAGFNATGRIAGGKPSEAICKVAGELEAELIVMGTRGMSRVRSAVLGSVSARVVSHGHRPVLVVPPGSGSQGR